MIQELSSTELESLEKHINETIDYCLNNEKYNPDTINAEDLIDDINWLYKKAGLKGIKKDKIILCESYEDEKRQLKAKGKLDNDTASKDIDINVMAKTWEKLYSHVKDARNVYLKYINTIRRIDGLQSQIWDPISRSVQNAFESGFGFVYNVNWLTFYSFCIKVGWIPEKEAEDFNRYYSFMRRGIWSIQFFKDSCYLTQMPKKIHRDNERHLHSIESRALEWRDGGKCRNYYIRGVSFPEELWEKISSGTITTSEVLAIDNMELRMATLSVISPKKLIKDLNARLISTHIQKKRGKEYLGEHYEKIEQKPIELYKVEDTRQLNIGEPIYILFYVDPSTGREYFSYVEAKNATSAAAAMASKFGLTEQQYINDMVVEA